MRAIASSADVAALGARAEDDAVARGLGHLDAHRLAVDVQQALEHPLTAARDAVHPGPREPQRARPGGPPGGP